MIILVDVGKFDFLMLKIFLATITLIRKIDEKSCVRRSEQGPGALCCLTVARPTYGADAHLALDCEPTDTFGHAGQPASA